MADTIKISLEEVSNTASNIRTLNKNMYTSLNDIKTQMNNLASKWDSPAGEKIRTNFNNMSKSFDTYREKVESYAKFLDSTVDTYRTVENTTSTNADSFA